MLNIEVIKFEAQDVITASGVVAPVVPCAHESNGIWTNTGTRNQTWCKHCGITGANNLEPGTIDLTGNAVINWDK